ncbi:MAG: 1,2-diacylglycerol 3-alpha-glucosyltransferase [Bradymonadia bacterium]|jgi:1,2-diacylglycerol 3-alpha-glucosyltransferase
MRVGILTDFPSLALQSGPSIHTRFLHDGLSKKGHDVTLIGPTADVAPSASDDVHLFRGVSYPSHPQVKVIVPRPVKQLMNAPKMDIIHGQTNNHVIEWANWLRKMHGTAVINTNIIHLPTHSHFILSDRLYEMSFVRDVTRNFALDLEKDFARMYNDGDGLVVQSRYMEGYWQDRGVEVPIHVVGRPIDPEKFSAQPGEDPFPASFAVGKRLICVCRHDREKNLEELIRIFDTEIAEQDDEVTLTIVGDGHQHEFLQTMAARARYADRIHFPGEVKHARLVDWYAHADVFVYTSLSETFGNVVNEALWCGVPVVALHDEMGVAHQVVHGENGYLVRPNYVDTASQYARRCLALVNDRSLRRRMGQNAATISRQVSHPDVVIRRFEKIYDSSCKRAKDMVTNKLEDASKTAQRKELLKHVAIWARYNYALLAIAGTIGKLGFGRKDHLSAIPTDSVPKATGRLHPAMVAPMAQAAE